MKFLAKSCHSVIGFVFLFIGLSIVSWNVGEAKPFVLHSITVTPDATLLTTAKVTAHGVLTTALGTYTESDYTAANWTALTGFKSAGDTAIDAATDLAWVTLAQTTSLTGMAGVPTIVVGDSYGGGIIAYILVSGDPGYVAGQTHGLIAAPSDQSTGIVWSGKYSLIGKTGTAIGTGAGNTTAIVANEGAGSYAAKLCDDLVLNGYSDWYLPSQEELKKLYLNNSAIGGFALADYWSSSELSAATAWRQYFRYDYVANSDKTLYLRVCAVRSF